MKLKERLIIWLAGDQLTADLQVENVRLKGEVSKLNYRIDKIIYESLGRDKYYRDDEAFIDAVKKIASEMENYRRESYEKGNLVYKLSHRVARLEDELKVAKTGGDAE